MKRLDNKVSLITGAAQGIGLATAHEILQGGGSALIVGQRADKAEAARAELTPLGPVQAIAADLTREEGLAQMRQLIESRAGDWGRWLAAHGVAALRPQVIHQAGAKHLDQLQQNYAAAGVHANCVAFIEDMAGAYEWADLVLCRAGALTVAELAAAGVASSLVPFPHAVDDHQTANAKFLASAGGAIVLPQTEMTPESVSLIRNYSRGQMLEMAQRARAMARPDAAEAVARVCEQVCKPDRASRRKEPTV